MVEIVFVTHATSLDNEAKLASGHFDVALSELGVRQAKAMGERHRDFKFAAVFCSDLLRSWRTAELAFEGKFPVIQDPRLRECDYGDFTRRPMADIEREKAWRIETPFPGGESYRQAAARIHSFLRDISTAYASKRLMIVGHRATQYGLEHVLKDVPLVDTITATFTWQPSWSYQLDEKRFATR